VDNAFGGGLGDELVAGVVEVGLDALVGGGGGVAVGVLGDGVQLLDPIPIRQADPIDVTATMTRKAFAGDLLLLVVDVDVGITLGKAA
jgi:hypothetical protein